MCIDRRDRHQANVRAGDAIDDAFAEGDLKSLFHLYCDIADAALRDPDAARDLAEAKTVVMRTASALPARSVSDALYKLAIWRRDAANQNAVLDGMPPADAIAYSAFRDLARLLEDQSVLTEQDRVPA